MVRIELWKDIEGFDGKYQVSNQGRVRSRKRGEWRQLKLGHGDGRYPQIVLSKDGKHFTKRVHRLVAEAFLDKPEKKNTTHIDHIDGNAMNNNCRNLRFVCPKENSNNPNTKEHMRGNKREQRAQRERRKMILRLEKMRTNDRCIIGDGYTIFYDRNNNYYLLSYQQQAIDLSGKPYIVDRVDDLPHQFYTNDYLNKDGTIDYAGIWDAMEQEMSADIMEDEDYVIVVNEDGDEVIEWLV